jgi:hypothetical protein
MRNVPSLISRGHARSDCSQCISSIITCQRYKRVEHPDTEHDGRLEMGKRSLEIEYPDAVLEAMVVPQFQALAQ